MVEIGKEYVNNLNRIKNLVNFCINPKKGARPQNISILVTPSRENALCYECVKPIEKSGINVLIINHKGVIEREEYNLHKAHYNQNG